MNQPETAWDKVLDKKDRLRNLIQAILNVLEPLLAVCFSHI